MNKITIFSILLVLLYTNICAKENTLSPFIGSTNYYTSDKDKAYNLGIYFKSKDIKAVLENKKTIYSSDSNLSDFSQLSFAAKYDFYNKNDLNAYTTINLIHSSNSEYNGISSILVGLNKELRIFTLGTNLSYSHYSNTYVKSVIQVSPYIGFSFGDYKSLMGNFYTKIIFDSISPDSNVGGIKKDYSTYALSITHNKNNFQTLFEYWFKDHIFALHDDGLTIQNYEEVYENSLSLSVLYKFSYNMSFQLSYIKKDYRDYDEQSKSKLKNYMMFLYYKF